MPSFCPNCGSELLGGNEVCASCADGTVYTGPKGLGGWLVLVGIGLVLGPLVTLGSIFLDWLPALNEGRASAHFFYLVVAVYTLLIAASVWLILLFFMKKWRFPKYMVFYLVGRFFLSLLIYYFAQQESISYSGPAGSFIVAAIWISYLVRSRRVKATFVKD